MLRYVIFGITALGCCSCIEPECSKFEKLLEKAVCLEWYFEKLKAEVEEVHGKVLDSITQVNSTMESFDSRVTSVETTLNEKISSLEERLEKAAIKMNEQFEKNQELLDEVKNKVSIPMIVFKATDPSSLKVADGQTVIFSTVLYNTGDAYDPHSGIFTAPVHGLYAFTTQFCVEPKQSIYIDVVKADQVAQRGRIRQSGEYQSFTMDAFLELSSNETVVIKAGYSGLTIDSQVSLEEYCWNTFSGVLIHT